MYDLILQIIFMLSLGALVYIAALAIPRVNEPILKTNRIREWVKSIPFHHLDEAIATYKDKFLRKAKIVVMKVENFINKNLNKDKDKPTLNP